MRAGALRYRIAAQRPVKSLASGTRAPIVEYVTFCRPWAEYLPVVGNAKLAADQRMAQYDAVFRIRWNPDITTEHRIQFQGRNYEIAAVTPYPENTTRVGQQLLTKVEAEVRA